MFSNLGRPISDPPGGGRVQARTTPLGRHLGDFGRHFGPSWAPRGAQNRAFGRQGVPKAAKIASKKRSKKKLDFLIEF